MILSELRDYLRQHGQASLQDMALHFDAEPDALRGMLQHWVAKGRITRHKAQASCGDSCSQCDPASVELYVWQQSAQAAEIVIPVQPIGCKNG